jgi:hypothetical protein
LREGNTAIAIVLEVYDIAVKFEIVGKGKAFLFLCYKLSLLKLHLLLLSKIIVSYEKCIVGLQANDIKRFIAIKKAGIVGRLFY